MTVVLAHAPTHAAEAAFDVAVRQAAAFGAPLVIANVVPVDALAGSSAVEPAELDALAARAAAAGVQATTRRLPGDDVVTTIDELVREVDASSLVIGSRHRSAVGKLLLGSAAQRLILTADCPVVVVKPEGGARGR